MRGPRGATLFVERSADVPLVWLRITMLGGAAADPVGREGQNRHGALLARRGAGDRDREALDRALDEVGASIDVATSRDTVTLSALCLSRHLDEVLAAAADILAAPIMDEGEHDKVLRESRAVLDDLRDDDSEIADRFFSRFVAPASPYARTAVGTESTLAGLDRGAVIANHRARAVPRNMTIGFAGDVDDELAHRAAEGLVARLPDHDPPPPTMHPAPRPAGERRLYLIDKPDRQQSQIRIGHPCPTYGSADFRALTLAETIFGGTFTSRMMQEIRVRRGWSYGAGASLGRARGPHWLRLSLAPAAETTADAVALVHAMYAELVAGGVTRDELEFARSHLLGSMPFYRATASQRLRLAQRNHIFGLPEDFSETLAAALSAVTLEQVNQAMRDHFAPAGAVTVVVASADGVASELDSRGFPAHERLAYDSY